MTARLDFYARHPFIEQADLDLAGNGDALALHGRLKDVAFIDGGGLPVEPDQIRQRAGVSAALWRSWPGRVEKKWPVEADGSRRANAELLEQMNHAREYSAERSRSGKKGAKKRWHGSAKAKPNLSHGAAMAIDSKRRGVNRRGVNKTEVKETGENGRGGDRGEDASGVPSSSVESSLNGNGKDPLPDEDVDLDHGLLVRDGEDWYVPYDLLEELENLLGVEEFEKQFEKLGKSLARSPDKRPFRSNAEDHVRNWMNSPVTKKARDAQAAKRRKEDQDRALEAAWFAAHPDQRAT